MSERRQQRGGWGRIFASLWAACGRRVSDWPHRIERAFGATSIGAYMRNLWLFVITGLLLLALVRMQHVVDAQSRNRHFTIGFTCAVVSATTEAGREIIIGSGGPETAFDRALERLGYPPITVRKAQARAAADLYVRHIDQNVNRQVGRKGVRLLRKDGSIDCDAFQRFAAEAS